MGEVVHLDGRQQIVDKLSEWLERAKHGEFDAVALCAQVDKTCVATSWAASRNGNLWMLLGAMAELKTRILTDGADISETKRPLA